jgi:cyclopropane fatty-acyl-phospholipid synthase-like methyltransferase
MTALDSDWGQWESTNDHDLLVQCVGYNFGPNPEDRLPDIREARRGYGQSVAYRLMLTADDTVLDIGSGCGFVGRAIAPMVKALHCCDLSQSFLSFCQRELKEFTNVECHLITYADLSPLHGMGINKAYSTAVWIHFNFYDMFHYLTALSNLLPSGGMLYFDYCDAETLPGSEHRAFTEHASAYKADRTSIPALLQFNSLAAVEKALSMTGFTIDGIWNTWLECRSVLARKL